MKNSKFLTLYETIYDRFKQGSGFLTGDVVKIKEGFKSSESFKALPTNVQDLIEQLNDAGYNIRVSRLHTANSQYGSFGLVNLPATHADIYQERSPGSFGNLVTIPIDLMEQIDTGHSLPPVSKKNRPGKNKAPYQDPTEPSNNKDEETNEQTDVATKQQHAKDGDYKLATKSSKLPGANKYDDTKPSKFKPLPHTKKVTKESVAAIEDIYLQILTEDDEHDSAGVSVPEYNKGPRKHEHPDYDPEGFGALSNCCGARIIMGDLCSDCGEHCEPDEEVDETGDAEIDDQVDYSFRDKKGVSEADMPRDGTDRISFSPSDRDSDTNS